MQEASRQVMLWLAAEILYLLSHEARLPARANASQTRSGWGTIDCLA